MRGNSPFLGRFAGGSPIQVAGAFSLALAVLVAGCSDGAGRMPTSPSAAAVGQPAAHPGGTVQLPVPVVVDANVCEQLTLSWQNPGADGHPAQTWHLEIWEIVSGARVDPKVYNDANYALTNLTLAVAPGTYEVRITAKTTEARVQNSESASYFFTVLPCQIACTYSQGHWKNNLDAWPVGGLTLGTVPYAKGDLVDILHESVGGNGLVSLAHQLITAKLNIANGADGSAVAAAIAEADALIGSLVVPPVGSGHLHPSVTAALTTTLDEFNNGVIGPGHCE